MIKFSLHPSQSAESFAASLVDAREELAVIDSLVDNGTTVHTASFKGRDGSNVTLFWTEDNNGSVATVWEHTYAALSFNVPEPGVSVVMQGIYDAEDKIHAAQCEHCKAEAYSVGE